jgi:xanthine dehydrogenase accessory factor
MTARGEEGVLATVIRTDRSVPRHVGSKMILHGDGTVTGSVGGGAVEDRVRTAAAAVMADGRCQRIRLKLDGDAGVCGGEVEVFLEPVSTAVPCWIIGAGHVGRALLDLGANLTFRYTVVDDRIDYLTDLAPVATCPDPPAQFGHSFQPTARTVVLVASRNHELDGDYLEAIFQAEAKAGVRIAYLGVIGSRTKAKVLQQRFAARDDWRQRYSEVVIPVGLALGAETPHEIALSILAEVLASVRGAEWLTAQKDQPVGVPFLRHRPRKD